MKIPGIIKAFTYGGAGAVGAVLGLAAVTVAAGALASAALENTWADVLRRLRAVDGCAVPGCTIPDDLVSHDHAMEGHD